MKKIKYMLIMVAIFGTSTMMAQTQQINADNTIIKWSASKIGGSHHGNISLKDGHLNWEGDKIATGKFVVDMNSIVCNDIENADYNKKLVDHLKSDDFFGAEEFPEAVLEVSESTPFVNGKSNVKANLTIRGKTHPVEFEVMKQSDKLMATITVDRSNYDVKYRSKSFFKNLGDKLIYDEFTLEITINK